MRSLKIKHNKQHKRISYKQKGGFLEKIGISLTEQISNNPTLINMSNFSLTTMKDSLLAKVNDYSNSIFAGTKAKVQGYLCNNGGSKRRHTRSKRKRRIFSR